MIGRMLTQAVTVEPFLGESGQGPRYGPPVREPARVQEGTDYQAGQPERHEVVAATVVYLRAAAHCPERSRITLPSGAAGTAVQVTRHDASASTRHIKVVMR